MPLSIIIVNHRSSKDICNCLESASCFPSFRTAEWIIVDNDSKDDSRQVISSRFPFVRWIQMDYNAGFARANNEGIRQSNGEVVLFLNPDTLIENNAVEKCYQQFSSSEYVACGVQLLNADRTPQVSGSYFIKGGINILLPLPYLGKFFKWLGNLFKVKKTSINEVKEEMEVDWINGAFLMVKKTVIEKAGMLDEDFFLYAEEIECCSRLRKQGKLCIYGDLHVIHLQGEAANLVFDSAGKGYFNLFDKKGRQIMLSNFVRIRKQFGRGWFLFHLSIYFFEIPVLFIGFLIAKLFRGKKATYSFPDFRGYWVNLFTVFGKAGVILRNRPYFYKVI